MKSCACPEFIARLAPERAPTSVPEFIFLKGWQPRVAIEEYINGEWIVIDDNPSVELMDMNDRTVFCVDQSCASSDRTSLTYKNGQTIYFRGIELRTEVYLSQLITAVVFGLVMAALVCCNADKVTDSLLFWPR